MDQVCETARTCNKYFVRKLRYDPLRLSDACTLFTAHYRVHEALWGCMVTAGVML
jgi:hypothetical protein